MAGFVAAGGPNGKWLGYRVGCWKAEMSDWLAGIDGWEDREKPQTPTTCAEPAKCEKVGQS